MKPVCHYGIRSVMDRFGSSQAIMIGAKAQIPLFQYTTRLLFEQWRN
jgi:hypothetical protein